MFGNSKKNTPNPSTVTQSTAPSNAINSLVSGTKIKGSINAENDIRFDGHLEGDLQCSGRVIIGAQGRIDGQINCQNAIIEGTFEGSMVVKEILDIRETGQVNGEIKYGKLIVQPGGLLSGTLEKSGQKIKNISPVSEKEA